MKKLISIPIFTVIISLSLLSCKKEAVDSSSVGSSPQSLSLNQNSNAVSSNALAPVNLAEAGDFVILSKSGITNVYPSVVTGNVGTSPITGAALLLTCTEVAGTCYTADAAGPLPCAINDATRLTLAVGAMQTAYTDAAGRINPDFINLGAGDIGGATLTKGLYKWTGGLLIPADITISGGPNDVFIFQIAGTLDVSSGVRIHLAGGARAQNIYWAVADAATFGTTSHMEGSVLGMTGLNLLTGATINGRLLAQTAVTLQMNTVTKP